MSAPEPTPRRIESAAEEPLQDRTRAGEAGTVAAALGSAGPGGGPEAPPRQSQAREKRLLQRATKAEERLEDALRNEHDLRDQIERLMKFHRAVERSAPWRAIQALRGLVGRKW